MKNTNCPKGFFEFCECLPDITASQDEMAVQVEKAIRVIADELHLGKMDYQNLTIFKHEDGYDDIPCIHDFAAADGGNIRFTSYPLKNCQWDDEDKKTLYFVTHYLMLLYDRANYTKMLKKTSVTDPLTELFNSVGIKDYLTEISKQDDFKDYTVVCINLRNFKYVNIRYGARVGDAVLKKFGHMCREFTKGKEAMGRLGGDNFLAVIKKEKISQFLEYMTELKVEVADTDGNMIAVEISARMGIYAVQPGDSMGTALSGSSIALNMARKANNDYHVWYQPQMFERSAHDKEVIALFPKALRAGEFHVFYQPKVDLNTKKICGCEALSRWIHDGKIVPPMDFIPVLEKEGGIDELDYYVLAKVCADIADWMKRGIEPVRVSVNFSRNDLRHSDMADRIVDIIKKSGVESQYIEIEITELSDADDFKQLSDFVTAMRENGICTSIDDFGTGYSSLNLLKDLDVDIIKLDKSFISNIQDAPSADKIVVKNVVEMARALDKEVIAEGVEAETQVDFLKDIQCQMAQGFLYDKPLPHDAFEECLKNITIYQKNDN